MIKKIFSFILAIIIVISIIWTVIYFENTDTALNSQPTIDESKKMQSDENIYKIVQMINKVDKKNITKYLVDLVDLGPKPTRSDACNKAGEYIYNKLKSFGLKVEYQDWKFPLLKGKNIIATHNGINPTNNAVFIICAHYDTWKTAPGANDDCSGVAAMLEVADVISKNIFNHTIRFVAFSGHETGPSYAYGSTAYAKKAYDEKENIIAVLNLDMIGNTSKTGNAVQIHGQTKSNWLIEFIKKINKKYEEEFDIIIESFFSTPNSDETSFIDYGYDAVMFIQSEYWIPPNHVPEDDLTTINFDFLTNLTKLILASIVELANNSIDVQIQITKPMEGYIYTFDKALLKLPGFNLRKFKLRGMTYIIGGGITIETKILTDKEVKYVAFFIDEKMSYKKIVFEPPYTYKIEKNPLRKSWLRGRHKIGVQVVTHDGKTAIDEIDVIMLP